MPDKVFIDTNIFVYSFSPDEPVKKQLADKIVKHHLNNGTAVVSYQVIQEFLNVVYKKNKKYLHDPAFRRYLQKILFPLMKIFPSEQLYQQGIEICERWQLGFYDSLIIAAAIEANCKKVLSEDLQHGLKIFQVEVINPFNTL